MRAFFLKFVKPLWGILAGVFSLLLFLLLLAFPGLAELTYGKMIYPVIRFCIHYTFGLLPFTGLYLLILLLFFLLFMWIKQQGRKKRLIAFANFAGISMALFYVLWGFNYARPTIQQRLNLSTETISDEEVLQMTIKSANDLNVTRAQIQIEIEGNTINSQELEQLKGEVSALAQALGYITLNKVKHCELVPDGILRRLGLVGIYIPFTGEGLVEKSHNIFEKPSIIAHESAHGFGITDEGEANLLAYVACIQSENDLINYNGHIAMWQNLRYEILSRNLMSRDSLLSLLSVQVQEDFNAIREDQQRYSEWIPGLSEHVNDFYLKSHGVEDGVEAYLSMPALYLKYKKATRK
jgi:hypothetical protein